MMFSAIFLGIFGLIVGSFLNVLILRWGSRPITGRSSCTSCGRTLLWYDLVPIFSWLVLGGRCRFCHSRISIQYILVEIGTGLLFFLIGLAPLSAYELIFALPIAAILVSIAVYDIRHKIIPDQWVFTFSALGLIASLISAVSIGNTPYDTLLAILAGPFIAAPLFAFWFFSKGAWMGFGDVKLALGMGWLLGIGSGLFALFFAFVLGALVSVPLLFFSTEFWGRIQKWITPNETSPKSRLGFTMKSEIPFGPFLIAATLIVWIANMYGFPPINLII